MEDLMKQIATLERAVIEQGKSLANAKARLASLEAYCQELALSVDSNFDAVSSDNKVLVDCIDHLSSFVNGLFDADLSSPRLETRCVPAPSMEKEEHPSGDLTTLIKEAKNMGEDAN